MGAVALAFSILVQLLALALFAMGIVIFLNLVNGCFLLRRMALAGRQDYSQVILKSPMVPAVSTIATPPDASSASLQFTRRLLDLTFGRNEVVVVLDGPSPADLEIWTRELRLCLSTRSVEQNLPTGRLRGVYESRDPVRVVVIDKEAGGPIDALNAGVNASTSPVIGFLDPESDFVPDVLLRLIQPMLENVDETIAVSGGVSAPTAEGMEAQFGALESLRAWLTRGAAGAGQSLTMPFPGSAVLVKRKSILDAGGFTGGVMELFVRLHALSLIAGKPYRIAFLPEPLSHSRTPRTSEELRLGALKDQLEIVRAFRNRVAIAGPFGWQALRGLYYVRVVRPFLEVAALVLAAVGLALRWVDIYTFLLVLLSTAGVGIVISMLAVVLRELAEPNSPDERHMAAMFFAAIPENLVYRQKRNWWLIQGFLKLAGDKKTNRGGEPQGSPPAVSASSA